MLPDPVASSVDQYLHRADRLLPGRIRGLYLVGSVALGAFRPGRSDIDFVAVIDRGLTSGEMRRLRLVHAWSGLRSASRALRRGQLALPGTCNGVFVRVDDLELPVSDIQPVASHTGHEFAVGRGFDVNPVVWKVFAERGIAVRGPAPGQLGLSPSEPAALRAWNLANLDSYWRPWAEAARAGREYRVAFDRGHWAAAWGALGAPRLHHTIATGEVISKEAAGEYALDAFGSEWHPLIGDALAYWRGRPPGRSFPDRRARLRRSAEFVLSVVHDAHSL